MENNDFLPQLVMERCYHRVVEYPNGHSRKFIIITIRNTGKEEALACHGRLFSDDTPRALGCLEINAALPHL